MNYDNLIAQKIEELTRQRNHLEEVMEEIDIESQEAIAIDNKLRRVAENLFLFEQIALMLIEKDEAIEKLEQQVSRQYNQISVLRDMTARHYLRAQSAQAVASILKGKWAAHEKERAETSQWLKSIADLPDSELETQLKNLSIETI